LNEAEVRACLKQWYDEAEADFLDVLYQEVRPIVRELNKVPFQQGQDRALRFTCWLSLLTRHP
jgi:hypothetical protein